MVQRVIEFNGESKLLSHWAKEIGINRNTLSKRLNTMPVEEALTIKRNFRGKTKEQRFWDKVVKKDGCWEWTGANGNYGYGVFGRGGRGSGTHRAHRYSYRLHKGEIPDGMFVCHTCDNPPCTNPDHLFLGTAKDNHDDMVSKGRHVYPPTYTGLK